MPTTLKLLVYATAACAILIGSTFYHAHSAAEQNFQDQQTGTQRWAVESMVELEQMATAEPRSEHRIAEYEACAREVRADYSDDPAQAYGWVRTLCHY
jgi:hypothetical protein